MKRILHLSDLHFGTEKKGLVELISNEALSIRPDLVVFSGDFTQRARSNQFKKAKQFVDHFKVPCVLVPGNHDIPLYNIFERMFFPYRNYKKWLTDSGAHYISDNVVIFGLNSVTPFKIMSGFVSEKELDLTKKFFQHYKNVPIKIVVMHHNLVRSVRHKIINNSDYIIKTFANLGVNMVLSGHIHSMHFEILTQNCFGHPMYIITAGTAISTRTIEPNSFNYLELHDTHFKLVVKFLQQDKFVIHQEATYPL